MEGELVELQSAIRQFKSVVEKTFVLPCIIRSTHAERSSFRIFLSKFERIESLAVTDSGPFEQCTALIYSFIG